MLPEPEPVLPEPVLPEPVLPELEPEPMPVLPPGAGVVVELLPDAPPDELLPEVPPALLPDVPPLLAPLLGLVMPWSFRHLSRSAPTMPRHLLLALSLAPLALLPEVPPALLPDAPPLLLPDVPPLALEPLALGLAALPDEPPEALLSLEPEEPLEPVVAPTLDPVEPDAPVPVLPDVCASAALEIRNSAAAVAVPTSLNIFSTS